MDSKRPDVRVDEQPDEEGRVTRFSTGDDTDRSLLGRLLASLKR